MEKDGGEWIAFVREARARDHRTDRGATQERGDLIRLVEVREARRPAEGLRLEVHRREGELQTRGLQLRDVTILLRETTERLRVDRPNEVIATTAVGIDLSRDTALEEAEAEACTIGIVFS